MASDTASFSIEIMRDGVAAHAVPLADAQVVAGRAPGNGLVLGAGDISWHHAVLWREGEQAWVNDLNSTNGTFINGVRVNGPTIVLPGSQLRLGTSVNIRLVRLDDAFAAEGPPPLVVEDVDAGVIVPVSSDRFRIGPGRSADIMVPVADAKVATLVIHDDGEVWLGVDEDDRRIELQEVFEVSGRRYLVRQAAGARATTTTGASTEYAYKVFATLGGGNLAQATVEDLSTNRACLVTAESRVALLYVLSKQILDDRGAGLPLPQQGWVEDEQVGLGIWGRRWREHSKGHLNVVVHRVRKQLADSDLDPWCIEKRRRRIRLRAVDVELG